MLLDELVAGMSPQERLDTGALLMELAVDHTIVVIEHDMSFLRRFATSVTVLHEGRILSEGTVEQVQSDPKVREVYLGRSRDERSGASLADASAGAPVRRPRRERPDEAGDRRRPRGLRAHPGALRGVPRGARRHARVPHGPQRGGQDHPAQRRRWGCCPLQSGSIRADGVEISELSPWDRALLGIGYVPQGHQVFPQLTARENLQVVLERTRSRTARAIDDALDVFPRLKPLLERPGRAAVGWARPSSWPSPGPW